MTEKTGFSRVVIKISERKRYRGYVKQDDDKTIMQTSTSYVQEEEAILAVHDAFEIMKRDPLINLELSCDSLTAKKVNIWERVVRRYNGE